MTLELRGIIDPKSEVRWCNRINKIMANEVFTYMGDGGRAVPKFVTHARVDSSVIIIPANAFESCLHLQEVELPEGLKEIRTGAFLHCKSLMQMNVPSTVEIIGEGAFFGCILFQNVNIPPLVSRIKRNTFSDCDHMLSLELPSKLLRIEADTFSGSNLRYFRNVAIPPRCRIKTWEIFHA